MVERFRFSQVGSDRLVGGNNLLPRSTVELPSRRRSSRWPPRGRRRRRGAGRPSSSPCCDDAASRGRTPRSGRAGAGRGPRRPARVAPRSQARRHPTVGIRRRPAAARGDQVLGMAARRLEIVWGIPSGVDRRARSSRAPSERRNCCSVRVPVGYYPRASPQSNRAWCGQLSRLLEEKEKWHDGSSAHAGAR